MIVDIEDLDTDEDMTLHRGVPFTGTTQAFYSNGSRWLECPHVDGFEQGLCREWYNNGRLKCEWFAIRGRSNGTKTEWHENGQVKSVGTYLKG
jgi:antitoxin component YwqK of YwqJK toxin-antitoxin module